MPTKHFRRLHSTRGVSLIEVLIAMALFILSVSMLGMLGFTGVDLAREGVERSQAVAYAEEGVEALRAIRSESFALLVPGTYGLSRSSGSWQLSPSPDTNGSYTRTVTLAPSGSGRIAMTLDVDWAIAPGRNGNVHLSGMLASLLSAFWLQTTSIDFSAGSQNGVDIRAEGDGAVGLSLAGDWSSPKQLSTHDLDGIPTVLSLREAEGVLYAGTTVVAGSEFTAIDIADVSAGTLPRIAGVDIGAEVSDIAIVGGYAYLATSDNARELVVVRLSDMTVVNSYNAAGGANGLSLTATGTTLYLGRASSASPELFRFSIADPLAPLAPLANAEFTANVNAMAVGSGHLFLATALDTAELSVRDATTLASVNMLDLVNNADGNAIALDGTIAYLVRQNSGAPEVVAIDVTDPVGTLVELAGANISGNARDVTLRPDGRVLVSSDAASSEMIVLTTATLALVGTFDATSAVGAESVAYAGAAAFLGTIAASPDVIAVRGGSGSWESPQLTGTVNLPSGTNADAIAVVGNRAYVGTLEQGGAAAEFYSIDVTDPQAPLQIGSLNVATAIRDMAIAGNYAYLATTDTARELVVVNIANPAAPVIAGSYNVAGNVSGLSVAASGTTIYLGTQNNTGGTGREFHILNAAIPGAIVLLGAREIGADITDIVLAGQFAACASGNNAKELTILDVGNPASILEASSYNTSGTADGLSVDVDGSIVYLGTQNNGGTADFYTFNLFINGNVTLAGFLDLAGDNAGIAVANSMAFVANNRAGAGLTVIDVTTPGTPVVRAHMTPGSNAADVAADGIRAYVALTLDTREFAIIAPAGLPTERIREGWQTSSAFDSGAAGTAWGTLSFAGNGTGTMAIQVRTAVDAAGLPFASWVGDLGVIGAYYTSTSSTIVVDPLSSGTQWIQYRARLTGDGATTPILESVQLTYN
ncbi:MAG TPA: hypothetical protein VLB83_05745 [Candidatus Paceibacterota bacterium]|nr:hypothetical protein [Candidatus Paceibacterota bacterium]